MCPVVFREAAIGALTAFAKRVNPERITAESRPLQETLSEESRGRWEALAAGTMTLDAKESADWFLLRLCLLDFIADFANWDNSTVPAYLETSRALTQAAHEALGGVPGTRPLVVDPFCGGGSIPLEALRVGADAFASDLNPVPVLLNKVVLEYIPSMASGWPRKCGSGARGSRPKPSGNWPSSIRKIRTARRRSPTCGRGRFAVRVRRAARKSR